MIKSTANKLIYSNYFVPSCLIAGILLRALWIILIDSIPMSDADWYYNTGLRISNGEGYTLNGVPTAYYPAGYPMFLGLIFFIFGNNILAAKLANLLLSAGIIYLSYLICKRLFKSELAARITILIIALYPNYIAYTSILATEILFTFLLFLGLYLLLISEKRFWMLMLAGIVWGAMSLVKPQGLFIPFLFLLASLFQYKGAFWQKLKPVIVVYVFMIVVITPWIIRNYYVFDGALTISTNDGINILMGNNPYATSIYHLEQDVLTYIWDEENEYPIDSMMDKITNSPNWTRYGFKDEYYANTKLRNKALNYITENPGATLKMFPKKLWMNYRRGYEGVGWATAQIELAPWKKKAVSVYTIITNGIYYFVMFLFFCWCINWAYKRFIKKESVYLPIFGFLMIGYFSLLAFVYFADYRFNFPIIPIFTMLGASFIDNFLQSKKENAVREPVKLIESEVES
ncbi:MAG: phospholipid carrier-dependent glycosyltransferase [Ignavibacteriae bacterium]|nr:MAG: phospholipid carrier-dependent glycosyltransferase [Ignavibacteriota bacterium]